MDSNATDSLANANTSSTVRHVQIYSLNSGIVELPVVGMVVLGILIGLAIFGICCILKRIASCESMASQPYQPVPQVAKTNVNAVPMQSQPRSKKRADPGQPLRSLASAEDNDENVE